MLPEKVPQEAAAANRSGTDGPILLAVGVALILGHAVLLLNAFRNSEIVSLSLALILVIFGYDLIKKGMGRMGYGDRPQAYYYQPYYAHGYYYYYPHPGTTQQPLVYPYPQVQPVRSPEPPPDSASYADRAASAPAQRRRFAGGEG